MLTAIRRRYPCFLREHDLSLHYKIGGFRIFRCTRCGANERDY